MARLSFPFSSFPWRAVRRAALAACILVLVVVSLVRVLALTPVGQAYVESRIENLNVRGQSIEIDGLSGDLLGRFKIEELRVADSQGSWLEAQDAELKWAPLALLSGHLKLNAIDVGNVSVSRRPELAPSSGGGGQSFVTAYTISQATFEQVQLAEGVAGIDSQYVAKGAFRQRAGIGELRLDLQPLSSGEDQVRADLSWGGGAPLSGRAMLEGQPNGLLATLVGAPEGQTVSAQLDAVLEGNDWTLDVDALVGGEPALMLEASPDGEAITITGQIDAALSSYTANLAERLGGRVNLEANLWRRGDAMPLDVDISAPNLSLEAQGIYRASDGEQTLSGLKADLTLAAPQLVTGLSALALGEARLDGDLTRTGSAWRYQGLVSSPRVGWGARRAEQVEIDGALTYAPARFDADVEIQAVSVSGMGDQADAALSNPVRGVLKGGYDRGAGELSLEQFDLRTKGAIVTSKGAISGGGTSALSGSLLITKASGLPATGAATWSINGRDGAMTGQVSGQSAVRNLDDRLQVLVGEALTFQSKFAREKSGLFVLQDSRLSGARFEAGGSGQFENGRLVLDANAKTEALEITGAQVGLGDIKLKLDGPVSDLSGNLEAGFSSLERSGVRAEAVDIGAEFSLAEGFQSDLSLAAMLAGEQLRATGEVSIDGQQWHVKDLRGDYGALQVTGGANGRGGDPEALSSRLKVEGTLPGKRAFNGTLTYEDTVIDADFEARDLAFGPISLSRTRLVASGAWPKFTLDLDANGTSEMVGLGSVLSLTPAARIDFAARTAELDVMAKIGAASLTSPRPAKISFGDILSVDATLAGFGGTLSLDGQLAKAGTLKVVLADIDLAQLGPILGRPALRGSANGNLTLASMDALIEGDGAFDLLALSRGSLDAPTADLSLSAELVGEVLTLSGNARDGDGALDLRASAVLPVETSYAARSVRLDAGRDAELTVTGGGAIAPLWSLAANPDMRVEGDAQVDLSAQGQLSTLRLTGPVKLRGGVFEDGETGLLLTGAEVDAKLVRDAIEVDSLTARGGRGGRLRGSGRYAYDGSGRVAIELDRLDAFKRRDFQAIVSGDLAVGRSLRRTDITGTLRLNEARLDLSQLPQRGYTTLEVDFGDPNGAREVDTAEASPVALDLAVKANRRLYITGAGVDSEWSVDARITGSPSKPMLNGQAVIIRGEADLLSRRFEIDEGTIRFDGAPDQTRIDIRAARAADEVTATVAVTGPVMNPDIELSSEPTLPEDEVISRVLFGQSPSQLSPFQAAQLAAAVAQLAGGGSAFDLATPLQEAIGLDRLDFGVDDTGGATLATGKYLARDVYLEVETGASGAPGVAVEWTPLRNVEIDANIDPELGPRVAVQWKRDFDRLPGEKKPEPESDE